MEQMNMQTQPRKRQRLAPKRLPEKLKRIRLDSGLTQAEMLCIVNPFESAGNRSRISQYEMGQRVPSIVEIGNYARHRGTPLEALEDDDLDLPAPGAIVRHKGTENYWRDKQDRQDSQDRQDKQNEAKKRKPAGKKKMKAKGKTKAEPRGSDDSPDQDGSEQRGAANDFESPGDAHIEEAAANVAFQADEADNNSAATASAVVAYRSIRLSEAALDECKALYLKVLEGLPFDKMEHLTPAKFVEMMMIIVVNDFIADAENSAITRRVRFFFQEKSNVEGNSDVEKKSDE